MDHVIRRIFMFLLGVLLGYLTGFNDAQVNERIVFVRMVQRVENFAERTIGERERAVEEAAREAGDPN